MKDSVSVPLTEFLFFTLLGPLSAQSYVTHCLLCVSLSQTPVLYGSRYPHLSSPLQPARWVPQRPGNGWTPSSTPLGSLLFGGCYTHTHLGTYPDEAVVSPQLLRNEVIPCPFLLPDHQKLEREARICRLLKHSNIGEQPRGGQSGWF